MARKFRFAPLNGAFMATSIIGVLISLMYVYEKTPGWVFDITKPDMRFTWGILFTLFFGVMFIASVISMTVADPDEFVELEKKKK